MREINKIAEGLFEKVRDRFEDVSLGDDNAHATQNPEEARFFNFDYTVDGKNYGNITLSIIDETSLKVYFSKNISHDLDDEQRKEWYNFLKELREFAKRNLLSFEPRDITRSTLKHRDLKQISKADDTYDKDDVVSESRLYGTSRSSYENDGPVKIIIRHSDNVDPEQRGARSRKIRAMYLENSEGERRKLPINSLRYARAMARHCSEGGSIDDDFGQHITKIAEESNKLRPFKAAMVRRVFEDEETQRMVEAAFEYHSLLKNTLGKMSGRKGYQQCKEEFVATSTSFIPEEDFDAEALKERFVKRTFNERMSDALPIVYKAYNMKKTNKFAESFESWANKVAESWDEDEEGVKQWGIEPINIDDLADAFAEPIPLGVDAINAINVISDIINSNELEEILLHAAQQDPEADARELVVSWLHNNVPAVYQELTNEIGDTGELEESGTGDAPTEKMTRSELLDYLNLDTLEAQHLSNEELRDMVEGKSHDMTEGDEYGADGAVYEDEDEDDNSIDAIANAIVRRILTGCSQGNERMLALLRKLGPEGIVNAAVDIAEFAGPVHEIGSSDVSGWVEQLARDAGIEREVDEGSMDPKFYKKETPSKKAALRKHYDWLAKNADQDTTYSRAFNEALEAMSPGDSSSPLTHAHKAYCDKCESSDCHCDDAVDEGRMKDLDIDLKQLTDTEFYEKYGKTKEEVKATLGEDQYNDDYSMEEAVGDDYMAKDKYAHYQKMKNVGAKPREPEQSTKEKVLRTLKGAKAWVQGKDDSVYESVQSKTNVLTEMRKLAGLK